MLLGLHHISPLAPSCWLKVYQKSNLLQQLRVLTVREQHSLHFSLQLWFYFLDLRVCTEMTRHLLHLQFHNIYRNHEKKAQIMHINWKRISKKYIYYNHYNANFIHYLSIKAINVEYLISFNPSSAPKSASWLSRLAEKAEMLSKAKSKSSPCNSLKKFKFSIYYTHSIKWGKYTMSVKLSNANTLLQRWITPIFKHLHQSLIFIIHFADLWFTKLG